MAKCERYFVYAFVFQLLMVCFRFNNNNTTMQLNYRLDLMMWWNPVLGFMSRYQLLKPGFPKDMMLYQVEPYIQMLMKLSIYRGLLCIKYVLCLSFHIMPHLFLLRAFVTFFIVQLHLNILYLFIQDSAIILLNKPPKLPVKVWMSFYISRN